MKKKMQTLTLRQWLIRKIDTNAYRAGKLSGMMHPKADRKLINDVGGLPALMAQARELERDENAVIDTSHLIYGTVLNTQTLDHAGPVELPGVKRIMTIENKANYESMAYADDTLYILCHGFFSPKERRFLEQLTQIAGEDVEYLHWGDMDYGGICIFKFIREEFFPKLRPYRMGAAEFQRAVEIGSGVELKPEKRKKYEGLAAAGLEELKQCILEKNMEIEQEILLAEIYKTGRT